jgi:hypothetical protein
MKTLMTIVISAVLPMSVAFATQYVKSAGGATSKISDADFAGCAKRIYRKAGQEGLSTESKKQLAIESLKGNTVNDLDAVKSKLKGEDACTYGADDEKF